MNSSRGKIHMKAEWAGDTLLFHTQPFVHAKWTPAALIAGASFIQSFSFCIVPSQHFHFPKAKTGLKGHKKPVLGASKFLTLAFLPSLWWDCQITIFDPQHARIKNFLSECFSSMFLFPEVGGSKLICVSEPFAEQTIKASAVTWAITSVLPNISTDQADSRQYKVVSLSSYVWLFIWCVNYQGLCALQKSMLQKAVISSPANFVWMCQLTCFWANYLLLLVWVMSRLYVARGYCCWTPIYLWTDLSKRNDGVWENHRKTGCGLKLFCD